MISATSPNQEGVEGTDAEEVWMITEESAILVMSTSLIGKDLYPSLKGGTFYVCSLQATSRCAIRGPFEKVARILFPVHMIHNHLPQNVSDYLPQMSVDHSENV